MALTVVAEAGKAARGRVESWLANASLISNAAFLDPHESAWSVTLEARWREVRDEYDALFALRGGCAVPSDEGWETVLLRFYGLRSPTEAARRCPRTLEMLGCVPQLRAASFSVLLPGAMIAPHRGPYRGVVKYHLGLEVPEPAGGCGLRVADEVRHWREGGSLVFDESRSHEVWNHTTGRRAVLSLDVVRPLRQPARAVNELALAAYSRTPHARSERRRHLDWERSW